MRRERTWIMRAVFGVVSLLVVLAIVGVLASRQLRATGQGLAAGPASGATASTVREQAQQVQQRVQSDVAKAIEAGAAARGDEAGK